MAQPFGRRRFLAGTAATAAAIGWGADLWTPGRAAAWSRSLREVADPDGTTLAATIVKTGAGPYRRLTEGPGWPVVVRSELAAPKDGRTDRRTPLAALVQLTDVHLVDVQSPGRVEFLDELGEPFTGAWRPQEALSTQVATSMVQRINDLGAGPVTGRRFDCVVSTGDNIDNQQRNELDWFVTILDGGRVVPDSGELGRYEGAQDAVDPDPRYWHPDPDVPDPWKRERRFPSIEGLLAAAIRPFPSPGLDAPWFSTHGNHDGLIQGNLGRSRTLDQVFTGDRKATGLPAGSDANRFLAQLFGDQQAFVDELRDGTYPSRPVTADPRRRTVTRADWVRAHLDAPKGPHGYTADDVDTSQLWFAFDVAPGVLGISLDTCGHDASSDGALTERQLEWLEQQLAAVHSQHLAADGSVVSTGHDDRLVLIFSHHTSGTMTGGGPNPTFPGERRILGPELVATLLRYPNVVAWVNGHTHTHAITPQPDPAGRTPGFWEINTASHIDFPEQARIVELVDNHDGTHSIHCTVIEHAAPASARDGDLSPLALASISRELAANDPQSDGVARTGPPEAHNVELVRAAPFVRGGAAAPATTAVPSTETWTTAAPPPSGAAGPTPVGAGASRGELAHTGPGGHTVELTGVAGALVAAGAAAIGASVALRRRTEATPGERG